MSINDRAEYKCIEAEDIHRLKYLVDEAMRYNWQPLGALVIDHRPLLGQDRTRTVDQVQTWYLQTMTRTGENQNALSTR